MSPERQTPVPIEEEMRKSYLDYAMSVIVGRALPDIRDGLKPVHRRVLYAMHELGLNWNRGLQEVGARRRRRASASTIRTATRRLRRAGAHGAGVLPALPAGRRAGQLRLDRRRPAGGHALHRSAPGQDRPRDAGRHRQGHRRLRAELRRVRARSRWSCPRSIPNLLVNGSAGIAVGMATNIPPHNLSEVVDGLVTLIEQPETSPSSS